MDEKVLEAVRKLCEEIAASHRLDLLEVSLGRERGRHMLRVTIDRHEEGVTLDEITRVSEELSRALDLEDPIPGSYTLEVASAGIERPLVRPSDYVRFEGREVKVRTKDPIEGRRNFQGPIRSAGEEMFVLDLGGEVTEIPYSAVAKAHLVVDWDEELKLASRAHEARSKTEEQRWNR